jgi:TrmH family RNA methyltransferase
MLGKIRIQRIQKLHQKKYRLQEKRFIAEGTKSVLELIKTKFPIECIVATLAWFDEFLPNRSDLICLEAEKFELEKVSCLHTSPDVLAVCELQDGRFQNIDARQLTLVVDAVRDPGNLGTIIRLADWFGIHQILATEDTVEWSNPKCIQASMGSFIRLQPCYLPLDELELLCTTNPSFAADLDGNNLYTSAFEPGGILVVSSESHGLHTIFKRSVKQKLNIPSAHTSGNGPESLNVATATGILLSEFYRRMQILKH